MSYKHYHDYKWSESSEKYSSIFINHCIDDFKDAISYIVQLPYSSNFDKTNLTSLFNEMWNMQYKACSFKRTSYWKFISPNKINSRFILNEQTQHSNYFEYLI